MVWPGLTKARLELQSDSEFRVLGQSSGSNVETATEVGVRAIQDHKVIEGNTCWKCRLSEGSDDK